MCCDLLLWFVTEIRRIKPALPFPVKDRGFLVGAVKYPLLESPLAHLIRYFCRTLFFIAAAHLDTPH